MTRPDRPLHSGVYVALDTNRTGEQVQWRQHPTQEDSFWDQALPLPWLLQFHRPIECALENSHTFVVPRGIYYSCQKSVSQSVHVTSGLCFLFPPPLTSPIQIRHGMNRMWVSCHFVLWNASSHLRIQMTCGVWRSHRADIWADFSAHPSFSGTHYMNTIKWSLVGEGWEVHYTPDWPRMYVFGSKQ